MTASAIRTASINTATLMVKIATQAYAMVTAVLLGSTTENAIPNAWSKSATSMETTASSRANAQKDVQYLGLLMASAMTLATMKLATMMKAIAEILMRSAHMVAGCLKSETESATSNAVLMPATMMEEIVNATPSALLIAPSAG